MTERDYSQALPDPTRAVYPQEVTPDDVIDAWKREIELAQGALAGAELELEVAIESADYLRETLSALVFKVMPKDIDRTDPHYSLWMKARAAARTEP